ncbi:hypothetical protein CPB84DRAFT_1151043 [Gymnopilus junonius]|uniref:DUF6699 domain-containing protein n=1 Tax=Gymnopilus junonius TaxID=109634 RepID=A0A9P5NM41_GYMJU|nr:hypothetical protein CPB84DRAFT_1151043 [Gymnopilus junonius]
MSNRARTPNTPFIPPLGSPEGSPQPPPVIPGQPSPGYPGFNPLPQVGGYAYPNSPYATTPFIPPSQIVTPGVVPTGLPPQPPSRASRSGVSPDFIGFSSENFNPYHSPAMNPHPMTPAHPPNWGLPNSPISPYPWGQPYPASAPAQYAAFGPGTPWGPPPPPLQSPWGAPPQGLPPQAFTPYGRPPTNLPPGPPPGPGWGAPPNQAFYGPPAQDLHTWGQFGPGPAPRLPPEPPINPKDRTDYVPPFVQGPHYGPVLEPFIAHIVKADIQVNPLIACLPEDGGDQVHLKWNMIFPTSTIQRSDDKAYISWSRGRDDPATYPRITAMRIVSETFPWMIEVNAQNKELGITCGEVIDTIGRELVKFSNKADFACLPIKEQRDVSAAYNHNRSRHPGVPGGMLGQGMKRLDFLRRNTMYSGLEGNNKAVKRLTGEALPCAFVLRCSTTFPMTKQEALDQETRMKASSANASPNMRARSRANSTSTPNGGRIHVVPPSSSGSDDDGDVDNDHR